MKNTMKTKALLTALALSSALFILMAKTTHAGFVDWISPSTTTQSKVTTKNSFDFALSFFKDDQDENTSKVQEKAIKTYDIVATGYSSTIDQTDSDPCITASGYDVCKAAKENIIAANFLPLKTRVQIPEIFGDKVFTVEDRMNTRFNHDKTGEYRVDVWFGKRDDAKQFGLQRNISLIVLK